MHAGDVVLTRNVTSLCVAPSGAAWWDLSSARPRNPEQTLDLHKLVHAHHFLQLGADVHVQALDEAVDDLGVEAAGEVVVLDGDEQAVQVDERGRGDGGVEVGEGDVAAAHADLQPVLGGEAVQLALELERVGRVAEHHQLQVDRLDQEAEQLDDLH